MINGTRKAKEICIRYESEHRLDSNRRRTGSKLNRLRSQLYIKTDRRLKRLRTGLNEYTLDVVRLRMPKVRFSVPQCPMMRWR